MTSPALPRNGCYNREPLQKSVVVQDGWRDWTDETTGASLRVPLDRVTMDPMSKDCQYSRTTADERCDGCKWKQPLE